MKIMIIVLSCRRNLYVNNAKHVLIPQKTTRKAVFTTANQSRLVHSVNFMLEDGQMKAQDTDKNTARISMRSIRF